MIHDHNMYNILVCPSPMLERSRPRNLRTSSCDIPRLVSWQNDHERNPPVPEPRPLVYEGKVFLREMHSALYRSDGHRSVRRSLNGAHISNSPP